MAEKTGIVLQKSRKPELEELMELLDEMTPAEQKAMLDFAQGVRWAKFNMERITVAAAQPV